MKIIVAGFHKILAFIVLFTYLYPLAFNFLALDTGKILYFVGFIYILIKYRGKIAYGNYSFYKCALCLILVAWMATFIVNTAYDFSLLLKVVAIVFYSFAAIFVIDTIKKASKSYTPFTILEWIIYAAIVQAILSFILFLVPSLKESYLGIVQLDETAEDIMLSQSTFRLIAISKFQYANMAVMYGFALLSAITLSFSKQSYLYRKKIIYICSILILVVAGILSARTFFLMILVAFGYYIYLLWHEIGIKTIVYIVLFMLVGIGIFYLLFSLMENSEYEKTFNWVFEWYINLTETGSFETKSSNTLKEMYLFPDSMKTWWLGDGQFYTDGGGFYMNTDVGYLRNLFYWGIFGSILVYVVQYVYYKIVMRSTNIWLLRKLLTVIILWVFLYNVKEFWFADLYWALFFAAFISFNSTQELFNPVVKKLI